MSTSDYPVVLLIEQELTALDATQVLGLHSGIGEGVRYVVLLPVEDAAGRVEAAMGALGSGEVIAPLAMEADDFVELQHDLLNDARAALAASLEALSAVGGTARGEVVSDDPVQALVDAVSAEKAQEAIVLTRPHVVAEFFHLDWTSRARRRLGVPVLHLLEHESFDEQAGQGEGISGL